MNHNTDLENIQDHRALHRERKNRPRMRVHGKSLKKLTNRGILRLAKLDRERKK